MLAITTSIESTGKMFSIPATQPGVEENTATFRDATISLVEPKDGANASIIKPRTKTPTRDKIYVNMAHVSDVPNPNLIAPKP